MNMQVLLLSIGYIVASYYIFKRYILYVREEESCEAEKLIEKVNKINRAKSEIEFNNNYDKIMDKLTDGNHSRNSKSQDIAQQNDTRGDTKKKQKESKKKAHNKKNIKQHRKVIRNRDRLKRKHSEKATVSKELRDATLSRDNYMCVLCFSSTRLNIHHKTYKNVPNEEPEDVVTLCEECHTNLHNDIGFPQNYKDKENILYWR
jgi:5-methylcytosine-specific restriction endonuclease McrA